MNKRIVPILASLLFLSACSGEVQDTRPGQPVAHRRAAFKQMLKVFEPMGVMMRTDTFDAQKFATLAKALLQRREVPWQYFKPDTDYPPTKAKPAVWSDPKTFEADRKAFFKASDHLAAVAGTTDKQQAKAAYEAVEHACHTCHDTFKTH
ncbi:cytochrome c [Nitrogeniibacter mangrovi]|uniref:Cytochrome c n=1 Tax=Nitrogeniibacter mangrovi TaxID=2016596 RepID=A0A6C1B2C1_9RHOO|nr:cytochrome c [Nitrogeniibacter mangrovi]QID16490.1 cytochrome c [Nitrogeniibacter mangrovi]